MKKNRYKSLLEILIKNTAVFFIIKSHMKIYVAFVKYIKGKQSNIM